MFGKKKKESNSDLEGISPEIIKLAPAILEEINKAKSILLHCHPSPDPDSVGSALAMKLALEHLGKRATVISGDSEIPSGFMHFHGAKEITLKTFQEVDFSEFDLFISLDSASTEMVSKKGFDIPRDLKIINIDHHFSNSRYGSINLVVPEYPATAQVVFDLLRLWEIKMNKDIAEDLFVGMYTDTGGFKYKGTDWRTFKAASELSKLAPDLHRFISEMESSFDPKYVKYMGLALSSAQEFANGKIGLAAVSFGALKDVGLSEDDVYMNDSCNVLRLVGTWDIAGTLVEVDPNVVRVSLRSRDGEKFDVSKICSALGGGGHKAASGATVNSPLEKVRDQVVAKARELYNL